MTIGFFAPLPLALMIPFMAAQSFAMGEAFGKGFQFGKRRVSSMTNEEFNSKSAVNHFEETTADINAMIPAMKSQMATFALLQSDIIKEMIGYIRQLPADIVSGLTGSDTSPSGDTFNQFTGTPTPTPVETSAGSGVFMRPGIPAFITPFVGPSGMLNDISTIPLDVLKEIKPDYVVSGMTLIIQEIQQRSGDVIVTGTTTGPLPSGTTWQPPNTFINGVNYDVRTAPTTSFLNAVAKIYFKFIPPTPSPTNAIRGLSFRQKTSSTILEANKLAAAVGSQWIMIATRVWSNTVSASLRTTWYSNRANELKLLIEKMEDFAYLYRL